MDADSPKPKPRKANVEFAKLVTAFGQTQAEVAAFLSRALSRPVTNYQVSRWVNGGVTVPVDVMDLMRNASPTAAAARADPVVPALTETAEIVPLFGYANAAGAILRLNEEQRVGVVPIHPAQKGSRSAFAFIVFGDSLSPMMSHGDVGYAIRNRMPAKGKPCLVELDSGETIVKLFENMDDNTLFLAQLLPAKQLMHPLRDVVGIHAVVGISFSTT